MEKRRPLLQLLLSVFCIAFILFVSGCEQGDSGTLTVQMTSTPGDGRIESVVITIPMIEVYYSGSEEDSTTGATEPPTPSNPLTAGWKKAVSSQVIVDLIALGDTKEILGNMPLPAGRYTQIKLDIEKAVAVIDGKEFALEGPSEEVEIIKGFNVKPGRTTTVTLDFDAISSIKDVSSDVSSKRYSMSPAIEITVR